jgi:hypothetical protein
MVELLDIRRPFNGEDLIGIKRATMPLREAAAIVIEDWADNKFRQLSAVIVTKSGRTIRSFDDIRRLHEEAQRTSRQPADPGVVPAPYPRRCFSSQEHQ